MSIQAPPIKQVPGSSANRYPDRNGYHPEAIVLHIMAGSLAGCDSWFANPAAKAGSHFGIGKNGEIHQYHPLDTAPFANGIIEAGYTARLISENGGANPNYWTLSIEHEGQSGDVVTAAQLDASTRLSAWLWATVIVPGGASGLALDRDHFLMHRDISPKSRPACPGWSEVFIADYIARVRTLIAPPAPVPVTLDGVKLGLIDKVLREDWTALLRDAEKLAG